MQITPNSITCVNSKYGYKYALHAVLTKCYYEKKGIFFVTADIARLQKDISIWQVYNNKDFDNDLISIVSPSPTEVVSLHFLKLSPIQQIYQVITRKWDYQTNNAEELIIFFDYFYNSYDLPNNKCYSRFTNSDAQRILDYHENFIKNHSTISINYHGNITCYNNCCIIFVNNLDYDHAITNFLKGKVTYFIDCEVCDNIIGCKMCNDTIFYEYKKIKGGYKVIGEIIH